MICIEREGKVIEMEFQVDVYAASPPSHDAHGKDAGGVEEALRPTLCKRRHIHENHIMSSKSGYRPSGASTLSSLFLLYLL